MSCALDLDNEKAKQQVKKMAQTVRILGKEMSYKKYQKKVAKKPKIIGTVIMNFTILLLIILIAVFFTTMGAE